MAGFRHAQAIELARMRVDVEPMLAGAVKLQSAEFEMLPAAWSKLVRETPEPMPAPCLSPSQGVAT